MRIRDRLIALATQSLTPRSPSVEGDRGGVGNAPPSTDVHAAAEPEAPTLPRAVAERMLQSIHTSQVRLLQTTEVIAEIASAVAHTDAILRRRPMGLPSSNQAGPAPTISELAATALEAANQRGSDGAYLLVGASPSAAPFAANGAFLGGAAATALVSVPGPPPGLGVAAATLTAGAPSALGAPPAVDILPLLTRAARSNGELSGRASLHEQLQRAASQLAHLQSKLALALSVLSDAAAVAEEHVPASFAAIPDSSSVDAGQLAQTFGAIDAARSLAERTLAIFSMSS